MEGLLPLPGAHLSSVTCGLTFHLRKSRMQILYSAGQSDDPRELQLA